MRALTIKRNVVAEITDILSSFIALTILEIVLGIDNLVFLAIISQKLPVHQQKSARRTGLTLAWVTRLILLGLAVWLTKLTAPLFHISTMAITGRDIFLFIGGLFLLAKATQEIHTEVEPKISNTKANSKTQKFVFVVTQIALLDIVFSLDSVLTAIGLTQRYWLMAAAITISILTMIFASEPLSKFIEKHPTVKMLALSFLILIGMALIADSLSFHIPRGYLYFAMGFSLMVEFLNLLRKKRQQQAS